jgi:dihydroorotase
MKGEETMKELLKNGMVYHQGVFSRLDVALDGGVIRGIGVSIPETNFDRVTNVSHLYIVPGFADVHVHLREPGFSYKERVSTGTLAGAHGGYTALCAMPNLQPPPDSLEHLQVQREIIARDAVVPVYPYGCLTVGQTGRGELADYESMAPYVPGFSDDGKGVQEEERMRSAMKRLAPLGKPVVAHCEDESLLRGGYIHDGAYARAHGHRGICSESEWGQVKRDLKLVEETGCRYHVCHVSARETVELIRQAKAKGLPVTCETAPHYLVLCDEDLQEEGRFKMNPPLRSREDMLALRQGILDGTIDCVATDHAPHTAEEKGKGLEGSLMGIVGLETAFPVLYTRLVLPGLLTLEELVERMAVRPREIFSLPGGSIEEGEPADLAFLDLETEYTIDPESFCSMGRSTPFAGWRVRGQAVRTMVNGRTVWEKHSTEK